MIMMTITMTTMTIMVIMMTTTMMIMVIMMTTTTMVMVIMMTTTMMKLRMTMTTMMERVVKVKIIFLPAKSVRCILAHTKKSTHSTHEHTRQYR